jgi:hypothetical protein
VVEIPEEKKIRIQLSRQPTTVRPIFADEVMVMNTIRGSKDEKGNVTKEGYIRINFIDMLRKQSLGEFVLSPRTAKALMRILNNNLKKLDEELKSKELPKIKKSEEV